MHKKRKKDSIMSMLKSKYILGFFKKYWLNYVMGMLFLISIDYLQTFIPVITGSIIDGFKYSTLTMDNIGKPLGKMAIIAVFIVLGRILWRFFILTTSRKIERDIRNDMFSHLEKLSMRYYGEHKTGEIMAYVTNDLEAVRNSMGQGFVMLFDVIAMGFFTVLNMIRINVPLTIMSAFPLVLISVTSVIIGPHMFRRFSDRQAAFAGITDFVQENLSGIKVVKAFDQEKAELEAFDKINKDYFDKNISLVKLQAGMRPIMNFISGLSISIIIGFGGYLAIHGHITPGQFTAYVEFLSMLVWPMMAVGMVINMITQGSAALKRVETVLGEEVEINDDTTDSSITSYEGSIDVKNLNYKYPDGDDLVLKNISFSVKKGETLGIVARTGSGKTTLINLLLRLYNVDRGQIFIGGHDINDIPLHVLRKNIGYVTQENFLFSDTIRNNIDLDEGNRSLEEVEAAAEFACVHDNVIDFKDGYDTVVGERGVTLSGGQKQRVSMARALIKDPEILILDDSVSAVDTSTEEQILKNLKEKRSNKTNIIIAHRISTLQNADQIIVIDDGKIIEHGTHEELVKNDMLYNSLYQKQLLEKDIDEEA